MVAFHGADPLLILGAVLLTGTAFGWIAQRLHLPSVTGQILAGVLLGPSVLHAFDETAVEGLQPLTHFALALIGVTVGAHLNLERLRNATRRLAWLWFAEALITPTIVVGLVILVGGGSLTMALLLGTLAVSTAPATIIAIVRETRSRGVFVKTLVAAVALNNMTCIFLFEVARAAGRISIEGDSLGEASPVALIVQALSQIGLAVAIGAVLAVVTELAARRIAGPDRFTTLSVLSLLLTYGIALQLGVSPLAAALALGAVQANLSPSRDRVADSVFANFEPVILCAFFTLAGMHLSLALAVQSGVLALVFFLARALGKITSAEVAMRAAGATDRVRRHLGLALIPQAGVAVGLVLLVQDDPAFASLAEGFTAVVLTAVTLNEIVGPIATRFALGRSGELGHDRPRLVDFLQEENLITDMRADSMPVAIEQLVDLLVRSHGLRNVNRAQLLASVIEREGQVSTCLGEGLAVPHGELPEGYPMVGVMGLSRGGLHIPTPDGQPVHCMVLLATPAGERDRHLEVLAGLARTIGADRAVQDRLYNSKSAAHAYEILHGEDAEDFNYFLGDVDEA